MWTTENQIDEEKVEFTMLFSDVAYIISTTAISNWRDSNREKAAVRWFIKAQVLTSMLNAVQHNQVGLG